MVLRRVAPGLVCATTLAGCGGSGNNARELAAVHAALSTSGFGTQFPGRPSSVPCVIHGGGPYPGIRVRGTCATVVKLDRDGATDVKLVETWDGHAFRSDGAAARPGLRHTWEFSVSKDGRVTRRRDYGDFPPQYAV